MLYYPPKNYHKELKSGLYSFFWIVYLEYPIFHKYLSVNVCPCVIYNAFPLLKGVTFSQSVTLLEYMVSQQQSLTSDINNSLSTLKLYSPVVNKYPFSYSRITHNTFAGLIVHLFKKLYMLLPFPVYNSLSVRSSLIPWSTGTIKKGLLCELEAPWLVLP